MKIDSLTKEQIARFPEFVKKWTCVGLSTEKSNRPLAEDGVNHAYKIAGKTPPKKIVWCGSPFSQGLTRAIIFGLKNPEIKFGKNLRDSVRDSVWASVGDSVRASVWASVGDSVGDSVRDSVRDSVWASVWASVRDSVWDSGYGQHDSNWLAFYDYFKEVCGLDSETQKLFGIFQISRNAGWWLPHENICWISERHNVLNRNSDGRLHCMDGMALAYPDGWGIYALNGVRMKPEYVLTKTEDMTPEMVMKEENVDVRRELVRKFGVDRLKSFGKKMDSVGDYELLDMSKIFTSVDYAPHLLMKNPSIGVYHLEGVGQECKTVEHAINWRAGDIKRVWNPKVLT